MKVWAAEQNKEGYQTPSLEEVFGNDANDIREAFEEFIESLVERGECCIDSKRIAVALDKESMELYDTFITCCGSEDIGKEVNGVLYMFGANFGH